MLLIALYAAAVIAAALIETTWMAHVAVLGVTPDLVLVFVSALALHRGCEVGAASGFGGGLLQDLLGGQSLGLLAGPNLIVGFVVGLFARTVYLESVLTPIAVVAAATVGYELLGFGVAAVAGYPLPPWTEGLKAVAVGACYNGIVAPLVFAWVRRAERWFRRADGTA